MPAGNPGPFPARTFVDETVNRTSKPTRLGRSSSSGLPVAGAKARKEKERAFEQIHDLGVHPLYALNLGLYQASLMNYFLDVFEESFKEAAQRTAEERVADKLQ